MAGRLRTQFGNQQIENQQRLRNYDAATGQDQKQANFEERLDFQRQKEGFAEAQKTGAAEQRAKEFESRNNIAQDRLKQFEDSAKQQAELRQQQVEIQQQRANLAAEQQLAQGRATIQRQQAGINFFRDEYPKINPQSPNFQQQVGSALARMKPLLVDGKGDIPSDVKDALDHLYQKNNAWAEGQAKPIGVANQIQDSLAASTPVYGYVDSNQKFVATKAGDPLSAGPDSKGGENQTHVQTTYIGPNGKVQTEVFPRGFFDSQVAASKARAQGAPVADAAVVAAPAGTAAVVAAPDAAPAIPQAAIDYLQQNPDAAGHFEAKYGEGASQQYLQRRE